MDRRFPAVALQYNTIRFYQEESCFLFVSFRHVERNHKGGY